MGCISQSSFYRKRRSRASTAPHKLRVGGGLSRGPMEPKKLMSEASVSRRGVTKPNLQLPPGKIYRPMLRTISPNNLSYMLRLGDLHIADRRQPMPIEMQWPVYEFTGWYCRSCHKGRSTIGIKEFQELGV